MGDVQTSYDKGKGIVFISLDIVVPALDGLRRRILTASHRADMIYPALVDSPLFLREGGYDENDPPLSIEELDEGAASSDDDFLKTIAEVLTSDYVKSLAVSLVARANDAMKEREAQSGVAVPTQGKTP